LLGLSGFASAQAEAWIETNNSVTFSESRTGFASAQAEAWIETKKARKQSLACRVSPLLRQRRGLKLPPLLSIPAFPCFASAQAEAWIETYSSIVLLSDRMFRLCSGRGVD